jgi:hypothetical protein
MRKRSAFKARSNFNQGRCNVFLFSVLKNASNPFSIFCKKSRGPVAGTGFGPVTAGTGFGPAAGAGIGFGPVAGAGGGGTTPTEFIMVFTRLTVFDLCILYRYYRWKGLGDRRSY